MNSSLHLLFLSILVFAASYWLTGRVVCYAHRADLMDLPNERSSHSLPTPRGGGMAIVSVFVLALGYISILQLADFNLTTALIGSGLLVALIGWLDDRSHVSVKMRLVVQFVAAAWGAYWLGVVDSTNGLPTILRYLLLFVVLLYLVWMLNLYNFMDGINGIAGVEAITVCCGMILSTIVCCAFDGETVIPLLLLASVTGFLLWNFPSAKIFMGDVGSGFLGLTLALLSVSAAMTNIGLFWGWLILLGVFIVDATFTLLRRILRRQRFYEAHCSHAYQHAARRYGHTRVTAACGFINLLWLLPIALLVIKQVWVPLLGVTVAYLPLCLTALYFKAGSD